jgi:hypothetical protein
MFKLSKSFNSVIDPSKVSDSIRPTNVLYLPEDHTPNTESGILAFISTFGKKSTLGNPTVLSVEEYNSKNAAIKEPVLRTSTNGFLGFHLIIKPGYLFFDKGSDIDLILRILLHILLRYIQKKSSCLKMKPNI